MLNSLYSTVLSSELWSSCSSSWMLELHSVEWRVWHDKAVFTFTAEECPLPVLSENWIWRDGAYEDDLGHQIVRKAIRVQKWNEIKNICMLIVECVVYGGQLWEQVWTQPRYSEDAFEIPSLTPQWGDLRPHVTMFCHWRSTNFTDFL